MSREERGERPHNVPLLRKVQNRKNKRWRERKVNFHKDLLRFRKPRAPLWDPFPRCSHHNQILEGTRTPHQALTLEFRQKWRNNGFLALKVVAPLIRWLLYWRILQVMMGIWCPPARRFGWCRLFFARPSWQVPEEASRVRRLNTLWQLMTMTVLMPTSPLRKSVVKPSIGVPKNQVSVPSFYLRKVSLS